MTFLRESVVELKAFALNHIHEEFGNFIIIFEIIFLTKKFYLFSFNIFQKLLINLFLIVNFKNNINL